MPRFFASRRVTVAMLLFAVVTVLGLSLGAANAAPVTRSIDASPLNYVGDGGFLA